MAESGKVPYVPAYGNITKALDKIIQVQTPERFTQDFLATKLAMPGGAARPLIPYFKRAGLLGSDGSPTELYRQFRNDGRRGWAAAKALKQAYASLYELNEYIHAAKDVDIMGVIVQVTGLEKDSSSTKQMLASFKALRAYADFEASPEDASEETRGERRDVNGGDRGEEGRRPRINEANLRLGYTINLNLPATSDIAVFNAIFKSLREHLVE